MIDYDVVVIGGGVIGASVSYYLVQSGLKVALVEKGEIASGTSSGCDGNVLIADKQPGFDTDLAFVSQKLMANLNQELNYDLDYTQKGSIYVIESEEEWKVAENYVKKQVENGYSMRMMDYETVHEDEPYLAEDIIGGVEIDSDSAIYPMNLAYGMVEEATKNGLRVYNYTEVVEINLDSKNRVESVLLSSGDKVSTNNVVNAAGVWAPEIGDMVGIDIPIKPRQGQILVAEKTIPVGKRKIVEFGYMMAKFGDEGYKRDVEPEIEDLGIALVFEPTKANNFLIGSSRRFVGFDTSLSIEVMKGLAKRAVRFFPILKDINVIRGYAGLRPYVPDHLPIISAVDAVSGFYIAAGHEGDGICLAPITGKIIESLILNKDLDLPVDIDLPIDKLSFSRFNKRFKMTSS